MKLTTVIKLLPTEEQRQMLYKTLECANSACNFISEQAWQNKTFGRVPVHHLTYNPVREQFELSAQLTVRCIGKVVDSYKTDKKQKHVFRKHGAIPYDNRILTYNLSKRLVSIWRLGRLNTTRLSIRYSSVHLFFQCLKRYHSHIGQAVCCATALTVNFE